MNDNRSFELSRNEETKEISFPTIRFNLEEIYQHFMENIKAIKKQNDIIHQLSIDDTEEATNIMRSQIVF